MNSVAPIASNRVYVKEKYFNCSNFICRERSQWRLESRRSLFFPFLSVLFFVVVVVVSVLRLRLRLRLINQFLEEKNTQEQPKPGA